jgi:hypothetical protein
MNTQLLDRLDPRKAHDIILIKSKHTDEPLIFVKSGEPFWFPEGYSLRDVQYIHLWIPPQEVGGIEEDFDQQLPEMRECKKGCGGVAFKMETCCSERAAGYRKKWICNTCKHTTYSRKE